MLNEQNTFNYFSFSKTIFFFLLFLFPYLLFSQSRDIFSYPADTIITQKSFLKKTYYLRGRALNLSVMKWVMQDMPEAKKNIQLAVLNDELAIAAYGVGGGICIVGLVALPENKALGAKLIKYGGYSLGAGVFFQLLSTNYKKKAVFNFNWTLKEKRTAHKFQLKFDFYPDKLGLCFQF